MGVSYLTAASRRKYRASVPDLSGGINTAADPRCLPLRQGRGCVNYDFSSGALKNGWGIGERILSNARCVWLYLRGSGDSREHILMYCDTSGKVYYDRGSGMTLLGGVEFSDSPRAVCYRLYGEDVILMCSQADGMAVWNGVGDAYTVAGAPQISSLAVHYERMFVTVGGQKNSVWFSDDLDPTNWNPELDEGGFVELLDERGRSNRVLSYNNYVYVFRDYGITRLTAYASQEDFSAVNLFVSGGRIYPDTVTLCGDVILFTAADGIYSFDGAYARKLLPQLDGLLAPGGKPTACYSCGKYFLAARLNDEAASACGAAACTAGENNGMLVYDRATGTCSAMCGADIRALCAADDGSNEKLYAVTADGSCGEVSRCGALFGEPLKKVWQSGFSDFGYADKRKLVREVYIDSKYDCEVGVKCDGVQKDFAVKGSEKVSRIRVNMTGTKVAISITACGDASIARPNVYFSLL